MRPFAVYSAMRLGLFLSCLVVLLALGARGVLAVLLAAVISLALSYVLLRRQRDSVARALLARRAGVSSTSQSFGEFLRSDAAAEDAAADAAAAKSDAAATRADVAAAKSDAAAAKSDVPAKADATRPGTTRS